MAVAVKQRSWFERLLVPDSPDRRRAERWASPRLSIYYWNGWSPKERGVKDISSSGICLNTEPEWSPGVKLMLTLQRKELATTDPGCWIAVEAEVVRLLSDGLALSFVPSERFGPRRRRSDLLFGANRKELDWFLSKLFKDDKFQFRPTTEAPKFIV